MAELLEGVDRGESAPPGLKPVTARISFFFDGTGNNRANTNHRLRNSWTYAILRRAPYPTGSYENHFSNVSILEENIADSAEGYDFYLHLYVSGVGTQEGENDDLPGLSAGYGFRGITAKVENAIKEASYRLSLNYARGGTPVYFQRIAVDTCGFSRGAAAARHCVHRILHDPKISLRALLEGVGWRVGKVEVQAVGLFDTVSSYDPRFIPVEFSGGIPKVQARFDDDVQELQLDAIREAAAVYQLAAAEEYRENFALTDISSAAGKGRHVYLPGAHSDIGGGYVDGAGEQQFLTTRTDRCLAVLQFMRPRGWYRTTGPDPELRYVPEYNGTSVTMTGAVPVHVDATLEANRSGISRLYTCIPLCLMGDFMKDQVVPVRPTLQAANDPGDVPGRKAIESYARSVRDVNDSQPGQWERIDAELARLRHDFLHVSFSTGIGMGVRIKAGRPTREVHHG